MVSEQIKVAKALADKQMWAEAAQEYLRVLSFCESKEIREKIAWCFSRAGKYDDAIQQLEILFTNEPRIAKWAYMMGYQYYCMRNWSAAVEWFEKALAINPSYFIVKYRLAYALYQLAGKYKQLTKAEYWQALGHLKDCHVLWDRYSTEKKQKEISTYFSINFLNGKMFMDIPNNRVKAVDYFQKALEIKPDDLNTQYNLAKTYYLLGKYPQAIKHLPRSNQYYVIELGAYLNAKLGEYDSANKQIRQLLERREKDYLYSFLAEVLLTNNDLDNAYIMAQKAINLGRNNHKNYYIAAQVVYRFGLFNKAISILDTAIRLKEKRFGSVYIECKLLRDEISSKIVSDYCDDGKLLDHLASLLSDNQKLQRGIIFKYDPSRGFGFIKSNNRDIFFHISNCKFKDAVSGDKVIFRTEQTAKGLNALDIARVSDD